MLKLAYLGEAKKLDLNPDILKLLIVRRPVGRIPNGFIHVPQLSPSNELFEKTQLWKANKFKEEEREILKSKDISPLSEDAWWIFYEKEFNRELRSRKDMVEAINTLQERLKEGKSIYLFCYCKDVHSCHRGLVGAYLKSLGIEVDFREIEEEIVTEKNKQISIFDFK